MEDKERLYSMMKSASNTYYTSAVSLKIGATIMSQSAKKVNLKFSELPIFISVVLLLSLSIEVGLKALAIRCDKKVEKKHDLKILFDLLPKDLQEKIVKQVCEEKEFLEEIEKNKLTFQEWRYFYENKGAENLKVNISFLENLSKVIVGIL